MHKPIKEIEVDEEDRDVLVMELLNERKEGREKEGLKRDAQRERRIKEEARRKGEQEDKARKRGEESLEGKEDELATISEQETKQGPKARPLRRKRRNA